MMEFDATNLTGSFDWLMPPSKSHMIRWLALGSQSRGETNISFEGVPGEDSFAMANCLAAMGSKIDFGEGNWLIEGSKDGLYIPDHVLNCGNSGTTASVVSAMSACLKGDAKIDGDSSLRRRSSVGLCETLSQLGCEISSNSVPRTISGRISSKDATIDWSGTSQGLTAMALASPNLPNEISLKTKGVHVSEGYWGLTKKICSMSGKSIGIYRDELQLGPWEVCTPSLIEVCAEESLIPMATLFSRIHGVTVRKNNVDEIIGLKKAIDMLIAGSEILDLTHASDIITPSAAIMAIGNGGRITGCAHARGKESDRISKTIEMLSAFGIKSMESSDGIIVPGGQEPTCPVDPVLTYSDHRMAMTAMIIASKTGGCVEGDDCVSATDPEFTKRIQSFCESA